MKKIRCNRIRTSKKRVRCHQKNKKKHKFKKINNLLRTI